jgi:TRAP-type C4-dicarboxylate transport system substrate-binding protein
MNRFVDTLIVTLLSTFTALSQQYTIKFATVAPEGTSWMEVMKEYDAAVRKESGGRLGFRIYPGGVQGDEKDVLRKIRLGQLHSAGITGVGIGEIAPRLRILDSPFLFKSYEEIDHIHKTFEQEFARSFEEGGYVLLGWAEVGFVYVFSNVPVSKRDDLKNVKMWTWEGDPVAEATFRALDVNPIPLSITDVLTSLQTRLIDGIYAPPMAAIGLQWWSRVKYMLDYPLANSSGAVVIQKKYFDTLPDDLKEILRRNGKTYMQKLTAQSRADNAKAIETIKQRGIRVIHAETTVVAEEYQQIGAKARRFLVNRLYSEEFLHRIEQALSDHRNGKTTK